jgi:acetylornithine deacetylase
MSAPLFDDRFVRLLEELLAIDTVTPMETGRPSALPAAQSRYREAGTWAGLRTAHLSPPARELLDHPDLPISVRERAQELGGAFFECQPNLVLEAGTTRDPARTLMLNFHMDTVSGEVPVSFDGETFVGRGSADAKGPGVALLAGVARALALDPGLVERGRIVIQSVGGEEGGAMGFYGTRELVQAGWVGRYNLFAEPSEASYFDASTTSMTASIEVNGQGTTDDYPHEGHNATALLGFVAAELSRRVAPRVGERGGKICVAGLSTGPMHNRVYGTGRLLVNLAYTSAEQATVLEGLVANGVDEAVGSFRALYREVPVMARTAADAAEITRLRWLKRGLPVLNNRDPEAEKLLARAGLLRTPPERSDRAFTCDAMWAQGPGRYAFVYGPGSLADNHAHAEGEFIRRSDLERYARAVAQLVTDVAATWRR